MCLALNKIHLLYLAQYFLAPSVNVIFNRSLLSTPTACFFYSSDDGVIRLATDTQISWHTLLSVTCLEEDVMCFFLSEIYLPSICFRNDPELNTFVTLNKLLFILCWLEILMQPGETFASVITLKNSIFEDSVYTSYFGILMILDTSAFFSLETFWFSFLRNAFSFR